MAKQGKNSGSENAGKSGKSPREAGSQAGSDPRGPVRQQTIHEANMPLRKKAHERLDQLVDGIERGDFYGFAWIGLQVEASRIKVLHRKLEGTDK